MKNKIKLSIIVPIYNVEQYLRSCLDSLLNQDLPLTDYEIICVNDCSPDNSRQIVLEYIDKYPNIRLIKHEVNKKVGGARNTGLMVAKGKYIWFVDSDDYIYPNILNKIISECQCKDLDLFCFNIDKVTQKGEFINKENAFKTIEGAFTGVEFLKNTFGKSLIYHLGYPSRALYRTDLLINKSMFFPEHVSYGEETVYLAQATAFAQRVASTEESFYMYRQTNSSVTTDLNSYKGEIVYQSVICAATYVKEFEDKVQEIDTELSLILNKGVSVFANKLIFRALRCNLKERRVLFSQISQNKNQVSLLLPYMTYLNRFVSIHTIIGWFVITILAPVYNLKKSI